MKKYGAGKAAKEAKTVKTSGEAGQAAEGVDGMDAADAGGKGAGLISDPYTGQSYRLRTTPANCKLPRDSFVRGTCGV